jgi:uncharacterized membrane protein YgaE (UPF0421/DUF939 family)
MRRLIARSRDWLDAADPGAVRRKHGTRTVLAALTAFVSLWALRLVFDGSPKPRTLVFAVVTLFVCALAVSDPRRRDRATTLGLCVPVLALAVVLAALAEPYFLVPSLLLLALVFTSFAVRRLGRRPAELAMVLVTGAYFAIGSGVAADDIVWFVAAAAVGIGWLAAWQLVLIPYDPVRSIKSATRSYGARLSTVLSHVARMVEAGGAKSGTGPSGNEVVRALRKVRLARRVLEAQLPGARAPGGWSTHDLTRLQVALYEAELGAVQLTDAAADAEALEKMPATLRTALAATLDAVSSALAGSADPREMVRLAWRADGLRDDVMADLDESGRNGDDLPSWSIAALGIASGCRRLGRAHAAVRRLQDEAESRRAAEPKDQDASARPGARKARVAAVPQARLAGRSVHITTALGLQAVVATGAAMGIAVLAGVEHPSWVFWTAFVVIAGSMDESLRTMLERVVGTVLGVVVGVLVAFPLPDAPLLVVLAASIAIFFAIYAAPVSHAVFVFWLNVAFAIGYAQPGGGTVDLLVERPLTTIAGAAVAALVVVRILPVRRTGQYVAAVAAFLTAVRDAVRGWTTTAEGGVGAALPAVDAAYRKAETATTSRDFRTLFGAAREAAGRESTELATLAVATTRLGTAVELQPEAALDERPGAVGARIVSNLDAAISITGGKAAALEPRLDDLLGSSLAAWRPSPRRDELELDDAPHALTDSVLAALLEVHAAVVRVAAALTDRRDLPA